MYVCALYSYSVPTIPEEVIGSPEIGVADGFELHCGCWQLNPGSVRAASGVCFYFMCMCALSAYILCATCVPGASRTRKASDQALP